MSNIQDKINIAAEQLANAFNNKKASREALKELKKALKDVLQSNSDYTKLEDREKVLKRARKDISEELAEIKKSKQQIAIETDEQKELDDFVDDQEVKYSEVKDRVVVQLSRDLADEKMTAEVLYKSGQLILVVARA